MRFGQSGDVQRGHPPILNAIAPHKGQLSSR
jgi:hypothetical protein